MKFYVSLASGRTMVSINSGAISSFSSFYYYLLFVNYIFSLFRQQKKAVQTSQTKRKKTKTIQNDAQLKKTQLSICSNGNKLQTNRLYNCLKQPDQNQHMNAS